MTFLRYLFLFSLILCQPLHAQDQPPQPYPGTLAEPEPEKPLSYGYAVEASPFQFGILSYYQLFAETVKINGLSVGFLSTWSTG